MKPSADGGKKRLSRASQLMRSVARRAEQEHVLACLAIVLFIVCVMCFVWSACVDDIDNAMWWLTLGSALSALAVVIYASSRMASIIARAARHAQILDELAEEVSQCADRLLECGVRRVDDLSQPAAFAAASAASELTKAATLLRMCALDEGLCEHISSAVLRLKQCTTDTVMDAETLQSARDLRQSLMRQLLRLRMSA